MELLLGNCLDRLKDLEDNSVDAIVTDPPYGLSFMGKKWDYDVPSVDIWEECLRVLKPGGYLLSFAGTRTQHRMAVNIEDAGFEIRDMIAWVYGSGFPKSLNIGKAVDKLQGNEREIVGENTNTIGRTTKGKEGSSDYGGFTGEDKTTLTKGESEWEGWGTALKPALEPITVARKPLGEKTVAENCLKWGVGGINIDGCRVESMPRKTGTKPTSDEATGSGSSLQGSSKNRQAEYDEQNLGRFPANLIHDGSDEVVGLFPQTKPSNVRVVKPTEELIKEDTVFESSGYKDRLGGGFNDNGGSASRFFYVAKASKAERNIGCEGLEKRAGGSNAKGYTQDVARGLDRNRPVANFHPTVKPIALMEYLVKLVSREGQVILDPFMGSGTTGMACKRLDREFIGIEMMEEYMEIAKCRIDGVKKEDQLNML